MVEFSQAPLLLDFAARVPLEFRAAAIRAAALVLTFGDFIYYNTSVLYASHAASPCGEMMREKSGEPPGY